ncbi:MAG: hypothetical protein HQK54_16530 [Oligoflexales bacterium]|nr:hypothetical protein [Oligoflexales bacterium]
MRGLILGSSIFWVPAVLFLGWPSGGFSESDSPREYSEDQEYIYQQGRKTIKEQEQGQQQQGQQQEQGKKGKSAKDKKDKKNKTDRKKQDKKQNREGEDQEKRESMFFPPWPTLSFDWGLSPIVGFGMRRGSTNVTATAGAATSTVTADTVTTTSEAGLGLSLNGIPVIPGNPGLYLAAKGALAYGSEYSKIESPLVSSELRSNFTRSWLGGDFIGLFSWYRHTLGAASGRIEYNGDRKDILQSFNILNDFGVLVLPFLSTHLTANYLTAYEKKMSRPYFTQNDLWLHADMRFNFMDFHLDLGPGTTLIGLYEEQGDAWKRTASGSVNYFRSLFGLHLIWKLYANASMKYVYDAFSEMTSSYTDRRLPADNVSNPENLLSMPEDSVEYNFFIGARKLIGPVGFGWQRQILIFNLNEKNGTKKETREDDGYTVTIDISF